MGKIVFKNVVCQIRDYDSLFFTKTEQNSDPKHTLGPSINDVTHLEDRGDLLKGDVTP